MYIVLGHSDINIIITKETKQKSMHTVVKLTTPYGCWGACRTIERGATDSMKAKKAKTKQKQNEQVTPEKGKKKASAKKTPGGYNKFSLLVTNQICYDERTSSSTLVLGYPLLSLVPLVMLGLKAAT